MSRFALCTAVVIALAGCDKLFGLPQVDATDGGGTSGDGAIDGHDDAKLCIPVAHDEDTDMLDDACDACPTFAGTASVDFDVDGLPDECDRDNSPTQRDKILMYTTFARNDLTDFNVTGGVSTYSDLNNGSITIGANTVLATKAAYPLTRVDFHLSGIMGATSRVDLQVGTVSLCSMSNGDCGGAGPGTCVRFGASAMGEWPLPSTSARRISLFLDGTNVKCEITDESNSIEVGTVGALLAGTVGFTTGASSSIRVNAIVIYGVN